jgi:hypothetical protein
LMLTSVVEGRFLGSPALLMQNSLCRALLFGYHLFLIFQEEAGGSARSAGGNYPAECEAI